MTNRETLRSLAEQVEALSGPSPEVDEAIHAALAGAEIEWQDYQKRNAYHRDGHWVSIGPIPPYTASIDSAMSLVPEGCLFTVRTLWDDERTAGYAVVSRYETNTGEHGPRRYWLGEHVATAGSPALALTAASLRAIGEGL